MLDGAYWQMTICDGCQKNIELYPDTTGLDNDRCKEVWKEWGEKMTVPCVVFLADMEQVTICEKCLMDVIAKKEKHLSGDYEC